MKTTTRRILASCMVVASATITAASWALTIDSPNQVAVVSANNVAGLEFQPLAIGLITSVQAGSNCDPSIAGTLRNNMLTVTGSGWPSGLHQCVYNLVGNSRSTAISASFLVDGNDNLTASVATIDLPPTAIGTPSQPRPITIRYAGTSPLANVTLGFENATGIFNYGSPCVGALCQHTFASAISPLGTFEASVFCVPRQPGAVSTQVLIGGSPLANLNPTAVNVVCHGLSTGTATGAGAGTGTAPPIDSLFVTAMPNPLDIAGPLGSTSTGILTLTPTGMGSGTLTLLIMDDNSISFANGARSTMVTVREGSATTVAVSCSPTLTDRQTTTISALSVAMLAPVTVQLSETVAVSCTGIARFQLFSSPVELDFGQIRVGTSKSLSTQVKWAGSGTSMDILLDAVPKVTAPDAVTNFSSASETPLMTPQDYNVTLTADIERDAYTNTFTVASPGGTPNVAIPIKAQFVTASVDVPSEVDLGVVCQNDLTGREVTLLANGTGRLTLNAPRLDNATDFAMTVVTPTAYPILLEATETATLQITPRASVVTHDATAKIEWPTDVDKLNGTNTRIATTNISMNYRVDGGGAGPRRVVFADTSLNQSSEPATVTVANCDAAPLEVRRIEIAGDFLIDSITPFTLPKGQRQTFAVRFAPGSSGRLTGQLRFVTDNETYVVALEGNNPDTAEAVSLYACTCGGGSAGHAAPLGLVLMWLVVGRRRRARHS